MILKGIQMAGKMKKFKVITITEMELFFAPTLEIVENIIKQTYPFRPLVGMEEISNNY